MSATDLDRYLTDEVVEKALAAGNTASECYYGCPSDMTTTEMHAALSAVLPGIIQQAKAEALRKAAEEFWARLPDGTGNGRAYNSHRVADMLHDRADEIAGDDS